MEESISTQITSILDRLRKPRYESTSDGKVERVEGGVSIVIEELPKKNKKGAAIRARQLDRVRCDIINNLENLEKIIEDLEELRALS